MKKLSEIAYIIKNTPFRGMGGLLLLVASSVYAQTNYDYGHMRREKLGRGLVAVRTAADSVAVSWRFLSADADDIAFDISLDGHRLNSQPLTQSTYFRHSAGAEGGTYILTDAANGRVLDTFTLAADSPVGYINIPLDMPSDGITPLGEKYRYTANDASMGDVDGDGRYEIILKWEPSNARDNSHDGYTGNVLIDCYTLDGEKLWRIDLGRNIRAGAHYTQMMVYDLDGDGSAELVVKTADGTIDGLGNVIGDADADYREEGDADGRNRGRIFSGPEYLTVFSGRDGRAMCTVDYQPPRGDLMAWGDNRANRADRFLACVAYLDGVRPSVVMCRGYYTRSVLAAYDWDGTDLKVHWVFDTDTPGNGDYAGQGNHNLRVADVDGDGCDEIIYGQMAVDHDGKGLYTTGMGHGDAMHLTAFVPDDPSLLVWGCHENKRDGSSLRDARTGQVLWQVPQHIDVGRCMTADIDPTNYGLEMWASHPRGRSAHEQADGVRNYKGEVVISDRAGVSMNSAVWWTGDLNRELLDKNYITKYDPEQGRCVRIAEFDGCMSNNWTKANVCLSADIVGDWREEVIIRTVDSRNLRVYVTPFATPYRFHTFLEDVPYRLSVVTQNVAYNQPTQVGFYFGSDLPEGKKLRGTVIKP